MRKKNIKKKSRQALPYKEEYDIAYDFAMKSYEKFGKLIKSSISPFIFRHSLIFISPVFNWNA